MTNDDDDDDDERTNHSTIKYNKLVRMPALEARAISPYHHSTIAPYLTPHRISQTQYNTPHVAYLISRAT